MSDTQAGRDYRRIEQAIHFLEREHAHAPSLDEVAAHVGVSAHHLQRTFKRFAGLSPKQLQRHMSAAYARACLQDAQTVLETTYAAGLSSPGRLHDLMVDVEAVTPGEMRSGGAGLTIRHGAHDTPFGRAHVALSDRGVVGLAFDDPDAEARVRERFPAATHAADAAAAAGIVAQVFADGDVAVPLLLKGTNLQLKVWRALLRIPEGALVSYGSLAAAIGKPTAVRAVASAVGANPVGWLIPCHRVLRSSGAIGGYRWGVTRKRLMLARELRRAAVADAR